MTGDDGGLSIHAVLQGIEAGSGPALDGTGAGGFLRVEAIREDLRIGCHTPHSNWRASGTPKLQKASD